MDSRSDGRYRRIEGRSEPAGGSRSSAIRAHPFVGVRRCDDEGELDSLWLRVRSSSQHPFGHRRSLPFYSFQYRAPTGELQALAS